MKAFAVSRHGGPEALEAVDRPEPAAGPGEVLVRVRACALNHVDLWLRNGVPGHRFPLPLVPGGDIAGDVEGTGAGVDDLAPGEPCLVAPGVSCGHCDFCAAGQDQLCARYGLIGEIQDGGYAELVVVPRRNVLPLPRGLSYVEAAAIPLVFLTAWHMLAARAALRRDEDVLIHAAGSGVSSAGIQIARVLGARRIFATAGSAAKLEAARALGATAVFNYREEDFARGVKAATGGRGVDVVLDHVGGEVFEKSVRLLARGGRIVMCGATASGDAKINLRAVFFKNLSIVGSTMGSLGELRALLPGFERGVYRPVVAATFPLERAREAQEALASREHFGKIVLTVGDGAHAVPRPLEVSA